MNSNINNLNKFFVNHNTLIINSMTEQINLFYLFLISHFGKKHSYKINVKDEINLDKFNSDDLFNTSEVNVYLKISSKNLNIAIDKSDKKILFIDYKNFKSFSAKYLSINSYNIKLDIRDFFTNELSIQNKTLIDFILNSPEYTYSEVSKAMINQKNYLEPFKENHDDKIISIRKEIFKNRNNTNTNTKLFYSLIKKEVELKKFNFLTY